MGVCRAYTLIELAAVTVIMAVMVSAVALNVQGVSDQARLAAAGEQISACFRLAQSEGAPDRPAARGSALPGYLCDPAAGRCTERALQSRQRTCYGNSCLNRTPFAAKHEEISHVVQRNIQALLDSRREFEQKTRLRDRLAGSIAGLIGSMSFAGITAVIVAGWLILNTKVIPGIEPFDPYPFVMLAMVASVAAIFLSTFVLINQNRMQRLADKRADLDVQISLLTEHELTRLIALADAIAGRLEVSAPESIEPLKRDVTPDELLRQIEKAEEDRPPGT